MLGCPGRCCTPPARRASTRGAWTSPASRPGAWPACGAPPRVLQRTPRSTTVRPSSAGARARPAGWTTTRCSWRWRWRTAAAPGGCGSPNWRRGGARRCRRRAASGPTRWHSGASCSGASTSSARRCGATPTTVACPSWATCPSSSPTTAPTSGHGPTCTCWTASTSPRSWPARRPTTSGRSGSAGATRCTAGTAWRTRAMPGGRHACAACCTRPTCSASTTSAVSRPTGRSRPTDPTRSRAGGWPGRGRPCSTRWRVNSGRCPSSPRTWATSRPTSTRCARPAASRG